MFFLRFFNIFINRPIVRKLCVGTNTTWWGWIVFFFFTLTLFLYYFCWAVGVTRWDCSGLKMYLGSARAPNGGPLKLLRLQSRDSSSICHKGGLWLFHQPISREARLFYYRKLCQMLVIHLHTRKCPPGLRPEISGTRPRNTNWMFRVWQGRIHGFWEGVVQLIEQSMQVQMAWSVSVGVDSLGVASLSQQPWWTA